ncbi:MAG: molecular chaperone TorD family protein [Pyrinomonadaceae bacterium]|nr:molecular chaperone TorD family protein [Pyrinomonadaceae bacterium]
MDKETEKLLAEAAEWRLISLLFDCPSQDWFGEVASLGKDISDEELRRAAMSAERDATEGVFHSIFGPGGPAPGREVSYRSWSEPGYLLSELSAYYNAFSYQPASEEVYDHVAVETGFIAYLRLKEAFAREAGESENAETTAAASAKFIDEHLTKYSQKLSKLLDGSGYEYLELASRALFRRVGPDRDKRKKIFLPVLEEENEETMFQCG